MTASRWRGPERRWHNAHPPWRWRRTFPGHKRELSEMRWWLSALLPDCPARDDLLSVATELGSNAIQHTASGRDGSWFAVEITWHSSIVQVAVTDGGGPADPHVIEDPNGERGRGLLLVQGLAARTGWTGDRRGRLVWAQVAWPSEAPAVPDSSGDPYQDAVCEGEAALARRFAGVPAWFGRSTLAWWAVAGSAGLVSAPTAHELAGLLYRLLGGPWPAQPPAEQADFSSASQRRAPQPGRRLGSRNPSPDTNPGIAATGLDSHKRGCPARTRCVTSAPGLAAAGGSMNRPEARWCHTSQ